MKSVDVKTPWIPKDVPWIPIEQPKGCSHTFALGLYVPPGQKAIVKCPHCGAEIVITGSGAIS